MAGNPSFFLLDDYQKTYSEKLVFDFDIEQVSEDTSLKNKYFPSSTYAKVQGDIEFFPKKPRVYWRSVVVWSFILGLIASGIFYVSDFDKNEIATRLFTTIEKTPTLVHQVKPKTTIAQVVEPKPLSEEIIEEVFIPSTEKTESIAEVKVAPESEPENLVIAPVVPEVIKPSAPKINQKPEKGFKTKDLARAKALSENTGRYVFIKFGADWCVPCKLMEETALLDETVVELLEKKFIVLDIDVDELDGLMVKQKFRVDRLPTLVILDELGNQIRREETALGTMDLIEMLESVVPYIQIEETLLTADIEVSGKSD